MNRNTKLGLEFYIIGVSVIILLSGYKALTLIAEIKEDFISNQNKCLKNEVLNQKILKVSTKMRVSKTIFMKNFYICIKF
jgi:hypothetical protein